MLRDHPGNVVVFSGRNRVKIDRIAASGRIPADEVALAKQEPVPAMRKPMPALAPHAADQAIAAAPSRKHACQEVR